MSQSDRLAPLSLDDVGRKTPASDGSSSPRKSSLSREEENDKEGPADEMDEFFNIRQANPKQGKGQWEIEIPMGWATRSNHKHDSSWIGPSLSYGVTDDMYLELEVLPISFGYGGDQGNGDLSLSIFNRFVRESGAVPAVSAEVEMRIPTGQGSSGVDGELHLIVSKTILPKLIGTLEGFVETANGGRGEEERENRRAFQWGVGPGIEYLIDECNVGLVNFRNQASEERGHHNENVLEIGYIRQLTTHQFLKAAIDIGLDGQSETPNFGAKLQYEIEW
jgi:hypothetical protein